jgi:hypothetical protein
LRGRIFRFRSSLFPFPHPVEARECFACSDKRGHFEVVTLLLSSFLTDTRRTPTERPHRKAG